MKMVERKEESETAKDVEARKLGELSENDTHIAATHKEDEESDEASAEVDKKDESPMLINT